MPNMPTSNTNVPSIVIGEKGADLILARAGEVIIMKLISSKLRINLILL